MLETSAFVFLYGGQITLSSQLIKLNARFLLSHQRNTQILKKLTPISNLFLVVSVRDIDISVVSV